jgi:hypothetical protein
MHACMHVVNLVKDEPQGSLHKADQDRDEMKTKDLDLAKGVTLLDSPLTPILCTVASTPDFSMLKNQEGLGTRLPLRLCQFVY